MLYDLRYWEILLIIRGYRRRNVLQYQLQRITAYSAAHCMGAKNAKPIEDWLPLYVDRYTDISNEVTVSDEDVAEVLAEIADSKTQESQQNKTTE